MPGEETLVSSSWRPYTASVLSCRVLSSQAISRAALSICAAVGTASMKLPARATATPSAFTALTSVCSTTASSGCVQVMAPSPVTRKWYLMPGLSWPTCTSAMRCGVTSSRVTVWWMITRRMASALRVGQRWLACTGRVVRTSRSGGWGTSPPGRGPARASRRSTSASRAFTLGCKAWASSAPLTSEASALRA